MPTRLFSQMKRVPVAFVSKRLGQGGPPATYSTYTHVVDGRGEEHITKIDEWMTPGQQRAWRCSPPPLLAIGGEIRMSVASPDRI